MRVSALIFVLAVVTATSAWAEKVKTNQATKVYTHAGEQAKVVLKVKSGQNMTVLAKEGRWLKVRVQGRTGWVPRTKVDGADDDELVRNTRRRPFVDGRSTKRGFGGEEGPDDRVGADATGAGDDEPAAKKTPDDDEDKPVKKKKDEPKVAATKKKKGGDDDEKPSKPKKGGGDDDEDKPVKKKGGDDSDEEPKVSDDDNGGDDEAAKADERPIAHVSEKTKILSERDPESDAAFTAKPSDVLYPGEEKGKWTFVETEEGDSGWIQTDMLDVAGGPGGAHKREIDLGARIGVTFLSQAMSSVGSTTNKLPDTYTIGTSAADLALGGSVLFPYKKDYVVGGEARYEFEKTVFGGVYYKDPNAGSGVNIGLTIHNFNLRAVGGYDLHKKNGMMVFARLGYRYQAFMVDNYASLMANPAQLPQEIFKAPTLGAALAIPKLTDKVGLKFSLDTALFGTSLTQTQGLEDGATPSAKALDLGAVFTYRWKKDMNLQGTYDLNYASIDFGKPLASSTRIHTGTDTSRTDMFHTVTFGVAKAF